MIQTGFDSRVKVYQVIENQLPSFILDENPKASEFLKQYYISQEYQSGSIDIAENLDQYLKLDNLTSEIIVDNTYLTSGIGTDNKITINVNSTKGFPKQYGLLKIGDEIITYTGITTNSFLNCQRGFSGITSYHQELNQEELLFETSSAESHEQSAAVRNLSSLFLKEFYKKLKYSLTPGLEDIDFVSDLNVGNFIKEARSFYKSKGTDESFKILFKVLYGVNATVVNLENFLIKPSSAEFVRREVVLIEEISGEPNKLSGQTIEKSTDPDTNASVSEVEVVTRNGKKYYKLSLFVGYDDSSTVQGKFDVTPSTKCLESVPVGSSVISVDSTIGFPESGTIISGTNTITYTGKSVNQFFGCSGIESQIDQADNVRTDDVYIGYEDGDKTKKVEFRILGSLSDFIRVSESLSGVSEGDFVYIKSLGNAVRPTKFGEKNFKEILVNSWFYNSNSRYHIDNFSGPKSLNLKSPIDRTNLKYGDEIEIVERGTSYVVKTTYVDEEIQDNSKSIKLFGFETPNPNANYDLRRKVSKASSLNVPLVYGNDSIISDISNVYTDNDYAYVASNSLPANNRGLPVPYSYQITKNLNGNYIDNSIGILTGKVDDDFTIISFPDNVPFLTGDRIFYQPEEDSLVGLETGSYYVQVLDSNKKEIRLYSSQSFVGSSNYLTFDSPYVSGIGTHRFTLYSQRSAEIGPQKILKKFPLTNNIFNGSNEKTLPGSVGLLVNGVEIGNYKSLDKIYYGPLNSAKVLNSGENYDVINLPFISVSTGIGSTAFIQPVVSGSIQKTYVENQDFDIQNIVSIGVSGGNGFGAVLEPIVKKRVREVFFDARTTTNSGGINTTTRQLTFLTKHSFVDGEEVIYSSNGNLGVGIGVGNSTLIDNSQYYIKTTSDLTVRLYQSLSDYSSGINTVGFNTDNTSGIHKFYTSSSRNTLTEIKVVDGGQQYTNRKLIVKPTGISTSNHTINFKNHGFNDGDLIKYSYQTSSISGVSSDTSTSFYVLKVNDNSFRICDAGAGGVTKSNYERKNYVKFSSVGSGYQYFSYPEISVFVEFTTPNGISTTQTIQITSKVRGKIIDAYLYESGTGYGSSILNFEKKPIITIQNGKDAKIVPNIINGTINSAKIEYGGKEYYSAPDIIVEDPTGTGSGAEIVPTISGGRISNVTVTNSGIGYSTSSKIKVVPAGSNALFDVSIRDLTINNTKRFNSEIYTETLDNKLKYLVSGYFDTLQNCFADNGTFHSKIIGWAYDGNPIYGAYGYSTPESTTSTRLLTSSYIIDTSYLDRPFGFDPGFFIEDYRYDGSGDLDIHNGRFCKTPEFPNGVYAYFSPIDSINSEPKFPYFIGDSYRSNTLIENSSLDQSFDFGSSDLLRNTYPYKLIDPNIENDFIPSYSDLKNQLLTVNSIASGVISGFDIVNSGSDYKVNDLLAFTNADDIGISAKVSSLNGKEVENVVTSTETYNNIIVSWNNQNQAKITILPHHSLKDNDYVTLSGFSTNLTTLDGFYKIGVSSQYSTVTRDIPQATSIGSTELYVSQIPNSISVGSSIGIGTETLKVLGIFKNENILKVQRGLTGAGSSHIASSTISVLPNSLTITSNSDYFDSKVNDKVFFNPRESVGVGTTLGTSNSVSFNFGDSTVIRDIPVKGIYLENHPFVTNQKVLFTIPSGNISVSTNGSSTYLIPTSGTSQEFYVVNKSINLVGLKTSFTTPELFFHSNGDDNDEYSIESIFNQIKGKVQRYKTTVSVSTAHDLLNGDIITLNVNPNLNVGIGTSTSVRVLYNTEYGKLIINPIGFGSENVIGTKQYYSIPTRQSTIDTAVGIAFTSKAISPLATRNAQQIYDYIWDNYSKFDVDGDGIVSSVDGLIVVREMFGAAFAGDNLISGIIFPLGATRKTASSIRSYISSVTGGVGIGSTIYDIDGHGSVAALNDGLMIARFATTPGLGAARLYSPSTLRGSFEIVNHGLKTGDKVLYLNNSTSMLKPIDSGEYFVHRDNDNSFQLGLTYKDVAEDPINPVSIAYTGASNQSISLINPPIQVIKNNSLKFDLSNSSLTGYKLKIYYDKDFKNEFVSTGSSTSFNISGLGTVGVSTTASLSLSYSENLPSKLYYNLEKSGYISTTDSNVVNYSQIEFIDSFYNNNYIISGVGTTTFSVYLETSPERVSYAKTECDNLEYFTRSLNTKGSIKEIGVISKGSSSKNIPIITEINSTDGMNANVFCKTKNIGDIKELKLINEGFEYPSDPTLQPTAYISPQIAIKEANTIGVVTVTSGGSDYINPPSIVIVNTLTGEKIDSGILEASLSGASISAVKVLQSPKGVPDAEVNLFATNNTNGFSIQQVQSSSTGIFTCFISKPIGGFAPDPFEVGDEVFIEGIKKESIDGDGFNSEEYGYKFFNVTSFDDTTQLLAKIVMNVSGLTSNTGIAKTIQDFIPTIINRKTYPIFEFSKKKASFIIGEKIISNEVERDLKIVGYNDSFIKVVGSYELSIDETFKGKESGTIATVESIKENLGRFKINFSSDKNIGWSNNIGILNDDAQVIPDNDYYQNLSYTIKSPITYDEFKTPVNNLLHSVGTKNFSDTGITSTTSVGIGSENATTIIRDIIEEQRVDTIYNFDLSRDIDTVSGYSKFLKLENKILTPFINNTTNNVLKLDDINRLFSNLETSPYEFLNLINLKEENSSYINILVRVTSSDSTEIQLSDLIILNDGTDISILEKGTLVNSGIGLTHFSGENLGDFSIEENEFKEVYLRFTPVDSYERDYDLKWIQSYFDANTIGIASTSIGFVKLFNSIDKSSPGITTNIVSLASTSFESLHASVQVINELTNEINFVELYLTQDGTNTFISEYYFDNSNQNSYSGNFIGSFGSNLQSNVLSLNFTNTLDTGNVTVKSSIIGFGTADTIGVGSIYRFKNVGSDGSERSAVYIPNYQTTTSGLSTSILDINAGLFNCVKSVVEVSAGSTKALHQVMMIHDGVDVYTEQMQFLSVSGISTSDSGVGLGTFGGTFENSGNNFVLKFYPDAGVTQNLSISNLNKCLYQTVDAINVPPDLTYVEGDTILGRESIRVDFFNSLGGTRINRKDFPLTSNGLKVFAREFDPTDNTQISVAGTFTSSNHFFSEGEQLIYTPKSTIVGLAATPMVYKLGGITTSLPSSVFVVNISENTFQISTTRTGTAVTFVSRGSGNSHQFEMAKKNEKTIITIDDVIQYPISFVKSSHQLPIGIGLTSTIFALSGISTVFPRDLLKIDSEYMSVASVGFGTTNIGPITGIGTTALVEVVRGFVGSSSTSHSSGTQVKVYRGAYNIEGNSIYFSEAPRGNPQVERDLSNLVFQTSEFSGRVFLRKNYDSNVVFDNVSNEFNGIGRTFTLTVGGANTVGLGTTGGNGIVLINGLFQSPTTENNPENNFRIIETTGPSGVTSVVFSSIRPNLDIISQYDINQNEIPRGGIIVSLGSSSGLGYAPLVGASVTAVVGAGGSIASVGLGTTNIVGSGYNGIVSIGVTVYQEGHVGTAASIMAVVGAGGTLSFTVSIGGTGYINPKIFVSDPSYENLKVTGVSRIGIGTTTATGLGLLLNVEVGASSTTGIGSTYFEVTGFNITRQGYSFRKGDVFKPVGLVTDRRLANPLSEFTLTVLDTFSDSFAAWQFGNLNYIDSIKNYQDGVRQNFPLYYNGDLLSFEKDENSTIDLQNLLLIFINGVLQEPGVSYLFSGGTSFVFTTAPKVEDEISIFFYRGTIGDDSALNDNVYPTLKSGDIVKVHKNNKYPNTISQNNRTIFNLTYSDKFETSLYNGVGIDEIFEKPVSWTKQKKDQKINGVFVYKSRSSIETQVYPTARVIKSISPTDQQIFVDNAQFFNYDNTVSPELFDILVINDALSGVGTTTPVGFVELMSGVTPGDVKGFSGVISGISTSVGIGTSLALRFYINNLTQNNLVGLETGNPIFIYNTSIGSGVTSIDNYNTSVVGVGTTYLDNVYLIHSWSNVVGDDNLGIITCNVHSSSNIIGLTTSGTELNPVGNFSWGKLSGFARSSSPISIGASGNRVDVGLTTFATVHRRGIGLKLRYETGALP